MGSISCGNCGQTHASVAEVRACHGAAPSTTNDDAAPAIDTAPRSPNVAVASTTAIALDDSPLIPCRPEALAGPEELGRRLRIRPGQDVPDPWADAERIDIDEPGAAEHLATCHAKRIRAVVIAPNDPDISSLDIDPFWRVDPGSELPSERVRHLLSANTVDARDDDGVRFVPIAHALSAGATLTDSIDGDVITADGTTAWCDDGPLDWFDDLGHVIPAVHLERGNLRPRRITNPDADLAPDQLRAVSHGGGGARIIAPAGSGKTRVLTERARHLIRDRGIDPSAVCLVAFNVRAREEMQARTTDLPGIQIRTLNSLALAIVNGSGSFARHHHHSGPLQVIDEREVRRLLDRLLPKTRRAAMTDPTAVWIEAINAARLRLQNPADVEVEFDGDVDGLVDVLPEFRHRLAASNALDFSEQILRAIELLIIDDGVRAAARRSCRILLVDEFQDLAPAHVLLLRLVAGPSAEIFGVGDDDQTIYGYNGASPEWLIEFDRFVPGSDSHDLEVNYRCPPDVVTAASNVLSFNQRRIPKDIRPKPGREVPENVVDFAVDSADPGVTIRSLVDWTKQRLADGAAPREIAVLTRVNATLLAPMIALRGAGIPTAQAVHASFMTRTGVAGALAWLDLATAPDGLLPGFDLATAVRRPPRALHPRFVEWISEKSSTAEIEAMANRLREDRDRDKVLGFVEDLEHVRARVKAGATSRDLLTTIRDDVGLGGALERRLDASKRSVDRSAHGDDLDALIAIADLQPDPAAFVGWLKTELEPPADPPTGDEVTLATVHRVKGQEWPHVALHEATAGLFPHRLSDDVEEERRLFHVAITRCSSRVLVTATGDESPFIDQMATPYDPSTAPTQLARPTRQTAAAPAHDDRREALRSWRVERAQTDGVPAYVVFNDRTMDELLARAPTTEQQLLAVPGIGPAKVSRYGTDLIAFFSND